MKIMKAIAFFMQKIFTWILLKRFSGFYSPLKFHKVV